MDKHFTDLVNNAEFCDILLQSTVEEELDAEGDAIETEAELNNLTPTSKTHGSGIDHLMGNLAEASKEVVVPKTLKAYEQ